MHAGRVPTPSSARARPFFEGMLGHFRREETPRISTGVDGLDALLPAGGFRAGSVVEWISSEEGAGVLTLASHAGRQACRTGRYFVVIDPRREVYPPTLLRWGVARHRLLVLHPAHRRDVLWAWEESLRCGGVGAVIGRVDRFVGHEGRRLMLAAERGRSLGLLIRPRAAQGEPTWGDERLLVEPVPRCGPGEEQRVRVTHLRSRNGIDGHSVELCINEQTSAMRVAAELADPTADPPALRA